MCDLCVCVCHISSIPLLMAILIKKNSTHCVTARDARAECSSYRSVDATTHKGATRPCIELSKRCVGEAKRREAACHRHRQHTSVGQRFLGVKGLCQLGFG